MSRVPTGTVAPSILAILAASRWASVTPRVRRPTKASSAAPPFFSRISWAMRVRARSSAASSRTWAFSRNRGAGVLNFSPCGPLGVRLKERRDRTSVTLHAEIRRCQPWAPWPGPTRAQDRARGRRARPAAGTRARRLGPRPRPSVRQRRDDRDVVGGFLALALVAVDLDGEAARGQRGRQEDVVDPEPPAAVERPGAVVPPREEAALLAVESQRVLEAPAHEVAEDGALGVAEHDLAAPLLRVPDVAVLGRDIEVAAERERLVGPGGGLEEGVEAAIPGELVGVLLGADLLAVRPVDAHDPEAGDARDQEAPLGVVSFAREPARDRLGAGAREDRDAVVGLLAGDERRVAERRELRRGEPVVGDLRLLQAHDVGPPPFEPREEARQARPDRVHVPRRELHGRSASSACSKQASGARATPAPTCPVPAFFPAMPVLMSGAMPVSTTRRTSIPAGAPRSSSAGMRKYGCSPWQISRISAVTASASATPPAPTKRATAGEAAIAPPPRPIVSTIALSPRSGLASSGPKPGK